MNTEQELAQVQERLRSAQANVDALKTRLELESSFEPNGTVVLVIRRCIDTGRLTKIEGAFMNADVATRFARSLPGYGFGHDLFVENVSLYS